MNTRGQQQSRFSKVTPGAELPLESPGASTACVMDSLLTLAKELDVEKGVSLAFSVFELSYFCHSSGVIDDSLLMSIELVLEKICNS